MPRILTSKFMGLRVTWGLSSRGPEYSAGARHISVFRFGCAREKNDRIPFRIRSPQVLLTYLLRISEGETLWGKSVGDEFRLSE